MSLQLPDLSGLSLRAAPTGTSTMLQGRPVPVEDIEKEVCAICLSTLGEDGDFPGTFAPSEAVAQAISKGLRPRWGVYCTGEGAHAFHWTCIAGMLGTTEIVTENGGRPAEPAPCPLCQAPPRDVELDGELNELADKVEVELERQGEALPDAVKQGVDQAFKVWARLQHVPPPPGYRRRANAQLPPLRHVLESTRRDDGRRDERPPALDRERSSRDARDARDAEILVPESPRPEPDNEPNADSEEEFIHAALSAFEGHRRLSLRESVDAIAYAVGYGNGEWASTSNLVSIAGKALFADARQALVDFGRPYVELQLAPTVRPNMRTLRSTFMALWIFDFYVVAANAMGWTAGWHTVVPATEVAVTAARHALTEGVRWARKVMKRMVQRYSYLANNVTSMPGRPGPIDATAMLADDVPPAPYLVPRDWRDPWPPSYEMRDTPQMEAFVDRMLASGHVESRELMEQWAGAVRAEG